MKHLNQSLSRRHFLRRTAAVAGGVTVGLGLPQIRVRAAAGGVREGVRVGCIAVGNQGKPLMLQNHQNVVAVCDVDRLRMEAAKKEIEDRTGRACAAYTDYRRLLENREVDAVIIATPDHWHALQTVHACQAGKDVYVEKPLSLVVREGRIMVDVARGTKRIVQTGSMQRSDDKFRLACELVRSGRIGKVHTVRVGLPAVNFNVEPVPDSAPPPELDYDLWLGPAPWRPYNKNHVHYNFRFFWDYSGGQMTNWGAHHLDIAQWGLGMDESGPVEIEATAKFDAQKRYEVPGESLVTYRYANGVTVYCDQGPDRKMGTTFEGDQGTIYVNRGKLESDPADIITTPLGANDVRLYVSKNHIDDWYGCIKSRKLPICDVEIGHRSATVCHLGSLAMRTGHKLTWDPKTEKLSGNEAAARLLMYEYRAPWKLPAA
ncbi:MAG: Gfo/Idh/MocA family oxidoreductase [Verrucomicrobia bacterium]|nr:Gfo/Idh/MocA family oxidoreductase [Verrucomicrobiota bacterium]